MKAKVKLHAIETRSDDGCISITVPTREMFTDKNGRSGFYGNVFEMRQLACDILEAIAGNSSYLMDERDILDMLPQAEVDADMGADEYRREKQV